jgi:hypothetical protein
MNALNTPLSFLQDSAEVLGHLAAIASTTSGLSRVTTLALSAFEGTSADQSNLTKLQSNYKITGSLCQLVQFASFITYITSGEAIRDAGNCLGIFSLMERTAFFIADIGEAILGAKEILTDALSAILKHEVCQILKGFIAAFSGLGFVFSIAHASIRIADRDNIRAEEKSATLCQASMDLVYAIFALAASVATMSVIIFGTPQAAVLLLGGLAALLAMLKAAATAFCQRYLTTEAIKLSDEAQILATTFNVVEEFTHNSEVLNQGCKLVTSIVKGLNIDQVKDHLKDSVDYAALNAIGHGSKTYSSDLSALGLFKRISEFLIPEEDGYYFWHKVGKNDLKIAKFSLLTVANAIDSMQYAKEMFDWEFKNLSDLLAQGKIGDLELPVFVKNILLIASIGIGIGDTSMKIHNDSGKLAAMKTRQALWQARLDGNDINGIEICRQNAIVKLRAKAHIQRQKINTSTTRTERFAAEKAKAKFKAAKRKLQELDNHGNFVVNAATFATYKLDKLKAKIHNWHSDCGKNILSIINDLMKIIVVALSTTCEMLAGKILAMNITTLALGACTTVVSIIKCIYDAVVKRSAVFDIVEFLDYQNRAFVF